MDRNQKSHLEDASHMETRDFDRQRQRRIAALGMIVFCAALAGWIGYAIVHPLRWQHELDNARAVLANPRSGEEQRRAAQLVLMRIMRLCAEDLDRESARSGIAGENADAYVEQLDAVRFR